jgi:hypothetical protein
LEDKSRKPDVNKNTVCISKNMRDDIDFICITIY